MAMIPKHVPEGPWFDKVKGYWWLPLEFIKIADDLPGNDYIETQKHIRNLVSSYTEKFEDHNLEVVNISTQSVMSPHDFNTNIHVAVAFKTQEELAIAKLLI